MDADIQVNYKLAPEDLLSALAKLRECIEEDTTSDIQIRVNGVLQR